MKPLYFNRCFKIDHDFYDSPCLGWSDITSLSGVNDPVVWRKLKDHSLADPIFIVHNQNTEHSVENTEQKTLQPIGQEMQSISTLQPVPRPIAPKVYLL